MPQFIHTAPIFFFFKKEEEGNRTFISQNSVRLMFQTGSISIKLSKLSNVITGGDSKPSNVTLLDIQSQKLQSSSTINLNDRAMQHPLCTQNTSAYVGQTAKMYCCLARLDRDLSVSTIHKIYTRTCSFINRIMK